MQKSFEINRATDPNLLGITLSDEAGFSVELTGCTDALTINFRRAVKAFIMGYYMDYGFSLNYHLDESCTKYTRLVGNIGNALSFLNENRLISDELYAVIKSDPIAKELLNKSSSYAEPSLEEDEIILPDNPSDDEMRQNIDQPTNSGSEEEKPENRKAFFERQDKTPSHPTVEQQTGPDSSLANSNKQN